MAASEVNHFWLGTVTRLCAEGLKLRRAALPLLRSGSFQRVSAS